MDTIEAVTRRRHVKYAHADIRLSPTLQVQEAKLQPALLCTLIFRIAGKDSSLALRRLRLKAKLHKESVFFHSASCPE